MEALEKKEQQDHKGESTERIHGEWKQREVTTVASTVNKSQQLANRQYSLVFVENLGHLPHQEIEDWDAVFQEFVVYQELFKNLLFTSLGYQPTPLSPLFHKWG